MIRIRRDQEITPKSIFVGGPLEFAKLKQGNFSTGRNRKCHSGNEKSIVAGRLFQKHLMFLDSLHMKHISEAFRDGFGYIRLSNMPKVGNAILQTLFIHHCCLV